MAYQLLYSKKALQDIRKLDTVVKKKIGKKIQQFSKRPIFNARKIINSKAGQYRWRVGDYRIIFDISGNTIFILRVGHRREIYK